MKSSLLPSYCLRALHSDQAGMRIVSPFTLCGLVVVWTLLFLAIIRYMLYSSQQTWYSNEQHRLMEGIEFRINNFDKRNLRQLNELYSELQRLENVVLSQPCSNGTSHSKLPPLNNERVEIDKRQINPNTPIPVLVIACNRVDYVRQTLDKLLQYQPSSELFPIVVSQDCGHSPTADAIASYGNKVTHIKQPDLSEPVIAAQDRAMKNRKAEDGYFKISRHYKWALGQIFDTMDYQYVIIVEDDLLIAPDFYSYFQATRVLLDRDPSIWCVSAWNDNGKEGYIDLTANDRLYRTDFFPGLGWMMSQQIWEEFKPKWPTKFWDDWVREPAQRLSRACIRPEISRTKTIGKSGVSTGLYYTQHLQYIVLNTNPVDFSTVNITYLFQSVYDTEVLLRVFLTPVTDIMSVVNNQVTESEVQVRYSNKKEFEAIAKKLKIMSDFRGGVPRTAYRGVVSIFYRGKRIHITPPLPFSYESLS